MKMGIHNRITEERYKKAKVELKSPKDDERVMKKYGFGAKTARTIRNTDNFYEYRSKTTTGRNRREHLQAVLTEAQEKAELPQQSPKLVLDDYKLEFEEMHEATVRPLVFAIIALGVSLFALIGTIILIAGSR